MAILDSKVGHIKSRISNGERSADAHVAPFR